MPAEPNESLLVLRSKVALSIFEPNSYTCSPSPHDPGYCREHPLGILVTPPPLGWEGGEVPEMICTVELVTAVAMSVLQRWGFFEEDET